MKDWWKQAKGRAKLCYRASQPQAFQISSDITYKLMLLAAHATPALSNSHISFNSQRSSKERRGAELCLLSSSPFASSLHRAGLKCRSEGALPSKWPPDQGQDCQLSWSQVRSNITSSPWNNNGKNPQLWRMKQKHTYCLWSLVSSQVCYK